MTTRAAAHSRRPPGPQVYRSRRRPRLGRRALAAAVVCVVVVAAFLVVQLLRPLPQLRVVPSVPATVTIAGNIAIPWASGPEQVVDLAGVGEVGSAGGTAETPIASVAKLMSALVVLHDHPLRLGDSGPSITVTASDVATYRSELAAQDSVVAVRAGEQLSELQALEAALIPSADNVIELLARRDAGTIPAFVAKMNAEAERLGLAHTHYAGPSGVDPRSVSTAADQVRLASTAMSNPVIAGIVAMTEVTLPVAGLQYNVDADLGHDGIFGVKTGWVPAGGASFVFAARTTLAGQARTVIGAVVGDTATPALPSALSLAERLVTAADASLAVDSVVSAGEQVATVDTGRGAALPVVAARGASLVGWRGATVTLDLRLDRALGTTLRRGEVVGSLVGRLGNEQVRVPLVTTTSLSAPSLGWRLSRL